MTNKLLNWKRIDRAGHLENEDDPQITEERKKLIQEKGFLRKLYTDNYLIFKRVKEEMGPGQYVEIGSGGGFIKEIIPEVVTSDVLPLSSVDRQFDVLDMPFEDESVDAFFMIYVFHHIKDVHRFFEETGRCLKKGGRIVMIEPTNNLWGGFIFSRIHHEHYDPKAGWVMDKAAPMTGSNAALPWIVFARDRKRFEKEVPYFKIKGITMHTPFRYLVSGGVTAPQFLPTFTYEGVKFMENIFSPFNRWIGMFWTIELVKT